MMAYAKESEITKLPKRFAAWFVLLAGLAVYVAAQGALVLVPLWARDLPPEVDDSLAFLVRTQVMEECFFQDCPALDDLKAQFLQPTGDIQVARQRILASFPFPLYHPLFSAVLLGLKYAGLDLITAYKVLWSFAPLAFGAAFGWLLASLWGMLPAGAALFLIAFKVYPSNGLHYLTPSNFAMGMAVIMWARLVERRGNAPWTLVVGSLLLICTHPIGGVYALLSFALAVFASERESRRRVWIAASVVLGTLVLGTFLASLMKHPSLVTVLDAMKEIPGVVVIIQGFTSNLFGALASVVNLKAGLFGSLTVFIPAVAVGILLTPSGKRTLLLRFTMFYAVILFAAMHHTHVISPDGDLFFRLWIPLVVILFGAVGNVFVMAATAAVGSLRNWAGTSFQNSPFAIERLWPIIVFTVLVGYGTESILSGAEILRATQDYMRDRQPVSFDRAQVQAMLSRSLPGERVLYTSTMCMAFYFIHGGLRQGAVYYHPSFAGDRQFESEWLLRPDLRFAVTYNPTVYHPSYATLDEKDRCISIPEYRYSPLGKRRKDQPIDREGFIPVSEFQWIEIDPAEAGSGTLPRLFVRNLGEESSILVVPIDKAGNPLKTGQTKLLAAPRWTGWLPLEISRVANESWDGGFRLHFPLRDSKVYLGGIALDGRPNHWPWSRKATLRFAPKGSENADMKVRFDWEGLLPSAVMGAERTIEVLHDRGSSVLFELRQ